VCECAACGTVWNRFGEVSVQQVDLWCVCVCECVCCLWDSLEQVWWSECAAGGVVVCVCVSVCAECGTVWRRFG